MRTTNVSILMLLCDIGCVAPKEGPADAESDAGEVDLLACVAPDISELELALEPPPPESGSDSLSFQGTCIVASIAASPIALVLTCEDPMNPIEFSLSIPGLSDVAVLDDFEIGARVGLHYATIRGVFRSPAWAAIRREGATSPSLIAVMSWQPLPWFGENAGLMSPVELEFLARTDCEESQGSCNVGPRRRAAVEVSVDGDAPSIVFDRNHGNAQSYDVAVGRAEVDEGNCEGVNETWFEVVLIRRGGA